MLSDSDVAEIRKAAEKQLHHVVGLNYEVDPSKLPGAIARAITEAIRQYDLLTHA